MKKLYLIGGTMGVGKTAVSQELKRLLPHAVFLDGDWCWDADPFIVTDETKEMVQENIVFLLNQFLHCSVYENVIFCWVMHQQAILDEIISRIDTQDCIVHTISLVCTPETLTRRIERDIAAGVRTPDVLERSIPRLPLYQALHTVKIDTDDLPPREAAGLIRDIVEADEDVR